MSFKIHVIHDLWYGYNEPTEPEDLVLPDVDVVILNGNLSYTIKRSMLYAFELANMYPNIHFVYNDGYAERYLQTVEKWEYEASDSMKVRMSSSADWPKNLHWKDPRSDQGIEIVLKTGQTISVWTCFGFPEVIQYDSWEDTWFYKNIGVKETLYTNFDHDVFLPESDIKFFGNVIEWATPEYVNQQFKEQETKIRNWEHSAKPIATHDEFNVPIERTNWKAKYFGILVTHLNPYKDPRLDNIKYKSYNIHWDNRPWITTNQEKSMNFLGSKLCSNAGRGSGPRSKFLEVDIF